MAMTPGEIAELAGVSRQAVLSALGKGRLEAVPHGSIDADASDNTRWIARHWEGWDIRRHAVSPLGGRRARRSNVYDIVDILLADCDDEQVDLRFADASLNARVDGTVLAALG